MSEKLAIYGGPKAKTTPNFPMYPGGLEIGEEEKKQVLEVLDNKYLFRYYGPEGVESKVRAFENAFKEKMGSPFALSIASTAFEEKIALRIGRLWKQFAGHLRWSCTCS